MLLNTIFSAGEHSHDSLYNECEKVRSGLNHCLASTKRVAEKSLSPNFQEGLDCLNAMCNEIEKIELTSGKTFRR